MNPQIYLKDSDAFGSKHHFFFKYFMKQTRVKMDTQKYSVRLGTTGKNRLTLLLLMNDFANTKIENDAKNLKKYLKPWHMGTHLRALRESYPMNTNMTGFRCFSKIFAFLRFGQVILLAVLTWWIFPRRVPRTQAAVLLGRSPEILVWWRPSNTCQTPCWLRCIMLEIQTRKILNTPIASLTVMRQCKR